MDNCFLLSTSSRNIDFYNYGFIITLKSISITNPDIPIVIFYDELYPWQISELGQYELVKVKVDDYIFSADHRKDLTSAAYMKLYVELLGKYKKVLYLDSDIVVLDRLDEIFEMDANLVAVGMDVGLEHEFLNFDLITQNELIYEGCKIINTGVICFDTDYWIQNGLLKQAESAVKRYKASNFKNCDQGILNIIAYNNPGLQLVSNQYNFCRYWDMFNCDFTLRKNCNNLMSPYLDGYFAKIVHWTGPLKPWNFNVLKLSNPERSKYCYECYEQFRNYESIFRKISKYFNW